MHMLYEMTLKNEPELQDFNTMPSPEKKLTEFSGHHLENIICVKRNVLGNTYIGINNYFLQIFFTDIS